MLKRAASFYGMSLMILCLLIYLFLTNQVVPMATSASDAAKMNLVPVGLDASGLFTSKTSKYVFVYKAN